MLIQDDWRRRVNVVNAAGADGHGNDHKHYKIITTNNTTVMPFIQTLFTHIGLIQRSSQRKK